MIQKTIRDHGGTEYSVAEGAEQQTEWNDRTVYGVNGFNSIAELGANVQPMKVKTDFITVTQAVDLDTIESDTATNNGKNTYPSADSTKVDFITVTQAVDLDTMESDLAGKQDNITLTTSGTSGASTLIGSTLNIPNYVAGGGGDVSKVGTPVNNQVGVWTGDGTIEGDANLAFDTTTDTLSTVNIAVSGTVDGIDIATDVAANTAKDTNVSTNLSEGATTTVTVDVNSSDGTNATLAAASTIRAGVMPKAKFDEVVLNTAKITYPSVDAAKVDFISVTQAVDLDTIESDTATNNGKVSYTDAAAVVLNTAKLTNVSTNLSLGTITATTMDVNSSDGTNMSLVEANTTQAGILGSDKWDEIVANSLKTGVTTEISNLSEDTTPQAGGELDMQANSIGGTVQTSTGDGATTIDWKLGNMFNFQFGAFNETFTFTAPTKPGTFILKLVQDSVGTRLATWPIAVQWPGGTAPTLTTTLTTGTDIITFYYDGTNYFAVDALNFS